MNAGLVPALALLCAGAGAQDETEPPRQSLRLLTYNVLGDPVEVPERMPALVEILKAADADIVALQEVAPWHLKTFREDPWVRQTYQGSPVMRHLPAPGGQYFLSKLPIKKITHDTLPGDQRRTVVAIRVEIDGVDTVFATTHMESRLDDGPVRARQLDDIFEHIEDAEEAVLIGDLNFGDGEAEESHLDPAFVDVWKALYPKGPGYTWNKEQSPMAAAGSFPGEPSRRIDRILVRSKVWQAAEARIVGDQPISKDGKLFPSDHFALLGILRRKDG